MPRELINGVYRLLGSLPDAPRPGLHLAHSLVTGELVTVALPGGSGAPPSKADLLREGDMFGGIAHPRVHRIVDWNADEVFVAWEYVAAWPLADVLERRILTGVRPVLTLVHDIGSGLGVVHASGAVYRGLNPNRIFVARDGRAVLATCPYTLSTGRGRLVEAGPPADTPIRFLAPEQIDGGVDGRSDFYTLAAIAYELLVGRPVHGDTDPVTLAVQILKTDAVAPSKLRDDVPAAVDDFFLHCLARDSNERPASAVGLLAHVRSLLAGLDGPPVEPVAAPLTSRPVVFPLHVGEAAGAGAAAGDATGDSGIAGGAEGAGRVRGPGFALRRDDSLPDADRRPGPEAVGKSPSLPEQATAGLPKGDDGGSPGPGLVLIAPGGQEYELTGDRVLVGRGESVAHLAGIDLSPFDDDQVVSRRHALLEVTPEGWQCRDLGTTNGTFVNGDRVPEADAMAIRGGDRLDFAGVCFELRAVSPAPARPTAP